MIGDYNTTFLIVDRTNKPETNNDIEELNVTVNIFSN